MKNGIVADVLMVTFGRFVSSIAMTTKAVKTSVQLTTRSDKRIVHVKYDLDNDSNAMIQHLHLGKLSSWLPLQ